MDIAIIAVSIILAASGITVTALMISEEIAHVKYTRRINAIQRILQ